MSALSFSMTEVHRQFEAALPAIVATARFAFRRRNPQDRAEAIAETQAAAWSAWHGLVRRGKDPLALGVSGIANNAVRNVLRGRKVGNPTTGGRGAMDVHHPRAQRQSGFKVVNLDRDTGDGLHEPLHSWREWLAGTNRVTPADEACFRVDFAAWLARLPGRKRQMAALLAEGHGTGAAAELLGVTPAAVSQSRVWLEASWREFQDGSNPEVRSASGRAKHQAGACPHSSPVHAG